jgi:hypothetical protein
MKYVFTCTAHNFQERVISQSVKLQSRSKSFLILLYQTRNSELMIPNLWRRWFADNCSIGASGVYVSWNPRFSLSRCSTIRSLKSRVVVWGSSAALRNDSLIVDDVGVCSYVWTNLVTAILNIFSAAVPWTHVRRIFTQFQTQLWHGMNGTVSHQHLEMAGRWLTGSFWRENIDCSVQNGLSRIIILKSKNDWKGREITGKTNELGWLPDHSVRYEQNWGRGIGRKSKWKRHSRVKWMVNNPISRSRAV